MNKNVILVNYNLPEGSDSEPAGNGLYLSIKAVIEGARKSVSRAVNSAMVKAYWNIGRLIVEEEQNGSERAEYGQSLINKSQVHPREVFADVLAERASAVIIAHNHPLGEPKPSKEDREVTKRMKEAASVLGINLLDHIIFNRKGYYSFVEKGEL